MVPLCVFEEQERERSTLVLSRREERRRRGCLRKDRLALVACGCAAASPLPSAAQSTRAAQFPARLGCAAGLRGCTEARRGAGLMHELERPLFSFFVSSFHDFSNSFSAILAHMFSLHHPHIHMQDLQRANTAIDI